MLRHYDVVTILRHYDVVTTLRCYDIMMLLRYYVVTTLRHYDVVTILRCYDITMLLRYYDVVTILWCYYDVTILWCIQDRFSLLRSALVLISGPAVPAQGLQSSCFGTNANSPWIRTNNATVTSIEIVVTRCAAFVETCSFEVSLTKFIKLTWRFTK